MNTFRTRLLMATAFVLAMSLISCETPTDLIQPENSGNTISAAGGKHTLVKYADWTLNYDANGTLVKLQSTVDPTSFREYTHSLDGTGLTILEYNGGKLLGKTLINLDAQGRCKNSLVTRYGFQNGNSTTSVVGYSYFYNAQNQLEKIVDQDNSNRYDLFLYSEAGNLWQVKRYDKGIKSMMTYWFEGPGAQPVVDLNQMNNLWRAHHDQVDNFLPLYGKFRNQLIHKFEEIDVINGRSVEVVCYKYKINQAGYLEAREDTRYTAGNIIENTYVFGYR